MNQREAKAFRTLSERVFGSAESVTVTDGDTPQDIYDVVDVTALEDLTNMLKDLQLAGKFNQSKFNKFVKFINDLKGAAKIVIGIAAAL